MSGLPRFLIGTAAPLLFIAGLAHAQPRVQAPLDLLRHLVEINSGSNHAAGVNQVQEWVASQLKTLGFQVQLLPNPLGAERSGKLLVGTLAGSKPAYVTIVGHADTVFEKTSAFQKLRVSPDGTRAFGPGVIDAKGGIIVALEGLKNLLKDGFKPDYSIRVVISPSEEIGSTGFVESYRKFSDDSWLVLALEPSMDDGSIVHSRKGNRWYSIQVRGREAHAGRDHANGINACTELAAKLVELSALTDYGSDVTVSVGRMEGGQDKYNIVCGAAHAKVDTRFASLKARDQLHAKIDAILKDPKITFKLDDDCPPYAISEKSRPYFERYLKIVQGIEGKLYEAKFSGGVADSNYFSREGVIIMDGLGPMGGKMHMEEEFLVVASLESRAKALTSFMKTLNAP